MDTMIDYDLLPILEGKHSIQILMEIYLHPYMSKTRILSLNHKQGFKNKFNKIKMMEDLGLVVYAEDSNTSMKGMILSQEGQEIARYLLKIHNKLKEMKEEGKLPPY